MVGWMDRWMDGLWGLARASPASPGVLHWKCEIRFFMQKSSFSRVLSLGTIKFGILAKNQYDQIFSQLQACSLARVMVENVQKSRFRVNSNFTDIWLAIHCWQFIMYNYLPASRLAIHMVGNSYYKIRYIYISVSYTHLTLPTKRIV